MCISAGGATSVESLKGSETVLGASSFEAAATLTTSGFDHLQLAVERMYLCRDVEDSSVRLMIASDLGGQPPIIRGLI